jgi:hypothetical protein
VDGAVLGVIAIPPAVYAAVSVRRTRFALRPRLDRADTQDRAQTGAPTLTISRACAHQELPGRGLDRGTRRSSP